MEIQQYPEPTAGAVIFNKKGKILLLKSNRWKDRWAIPGGHIEVGEKMEDTLRREVKEETGLDVYDIELAALQEFILDESFFEKKHFIFLDFTCKSSSKEVTLNCESQDYIWLTIEESFEMDLEPVTKRLLQELKKGNASEHRKTILLNYIAD